MDRSITDELLTVIRKNFYPSDSKGFFQQKRTLLQAITYPAKWLSDRGFDYPETRYFDLVSRILGTIKTHGRLAEIRYFCRYLLHAVQEHMKHHGEDYLAEAKTLQSVADAVLFGLKKQALSSQAAADSKTVQTLSEVHRILTTGPRKKRQPSPGSRAIQKDLF
jgi:hypothetical protein